LSLAELWVDIAHDQRATMLPSVRFFLALLLILPFATSLLSLEEIEIEVIPNPHAQACSSRRLDGLLEPYHLITKPLPTQEDTFRELVYRKVLTVPIPVYRFKQPARLSASQLEFQIVLVKDLARAATGLIHEAPVEQERAMDSWFLGYYWTPLVMTCGDEGWQHVGWKFTALQGNQALPRFYALMVNMDDDEESTQGIRIGGFKAPGWMVTAIIS
jgi:hypothetical protein